MKKLFRRLLAWLHSLRRRDKIMYIGGSDTLPPPLPREEETEVIARLEQGDPQARQTLIERNLRLVVYIARRFENTGHQHRGPDLHRHHRAHQGGGHLPDGQEHQAGHLRLPVHRERDPDVPAENAGRKGEVSFDEPLNTDWDGNELLLSDVLGTEADVVMRPIEEDVERDLLAAAIQMLSPREKQIITLRFGLGGGKEQTQKEVADQLGISQSYISRLEKRIINRLKKEILRLS